MRRALLLALLTAGCANPRPGAVRAMAPRPNPGEPPAQPTGQDRVRQNPWLARSWEDLTPAERRRVVARLQRLRPAPKEPSQSVWDRLGLPERTTLLFGTPALPPPDD